MKQARPVPAPTLFRLITVLLVGVVTGVSLTAAGWGRFALLAAWDTAAVLFVVSTLGSVLRFNAHDTKTHALRENPGRAAADILLTATSIASLLGVGFLLLHIDAQGSEQTVNIALGLFSVVTSWATVHTVYMLKYARLYYGDPEGGIDFSGQATPRYSDFAYLAYTVGMTFQVSDTAMGTSELRATVLKQALLSYVFGTVIIAVTINTLASLLE